MQIRAFAAGDEHAVAAVVGSAYADDPRLRELKRRGHGAPLDRPLRRTFVAEIRGEIVAVGTLVHGSLHPTRTTVDVVVAPRFRRRGIGTALLRELGSLAATPLRARGVLADEAAIGFLRRHGFELLSSTWEGRIDPAEVADSLPHPRLGPPPSGDEAALFFDDWYRRTHRWDPPAARTLEQARGVFSGEDVIAGSLAGVRDAAGRLVGAAELIRPPGHDPGDELYLVWAGTQEAHADAARELVAACVRFAAEAGKAIRFEVAGENEPILDVLRRLGVVGAPALGTFANDRAR